MKTDYATLVCGSVNKVKELLVQELVEKRQAKGLSQEELDAILAFSADWPGIREIESDPRLLTHSFLQEINWLIMVRPNDYEKAVEVTGEKIIDLIDQYLEKPTALEKALKEFRESTDLIHIEVQQEPIDEYSPQVATRQPVKQGHLNSISPLLYASIHVFGSIMRQLDEPLGAPS